MIPFLQRVEKSSLLVQLCADHEESADEGEPAPKELKFEWFDNENVESIIARFSVQLSQTAAALQGQAKTSLHVEKVVNPSRSADSLDHEVLLQAVNILQSYGLREVLFKDSCEYITTSAGMEGLTALTTLDVTGCGLTDVPEVLAALVNLQKLYLRRNKLTSLPPFIGFVMKELTHLDADDNLITTLPGVKHKLFLFSYFCCILRVTNRPSCDAESLQDLTNLHTLSLSNNRLKVPIVNLSKLNKLFVLHLGGNPLQYFPELSQAPHLLTVSLANLLIMAEPSWTSWTVEMLNQRTSRLSMRANTAATVNDTLKLLLSRSSAQHPLIAGGLAEMAADEDHRNSMLRAEGLLPQLVHSMMSENIIVAAKSVETLCKLTTTKEVALDVEKAAAISAAHKLMLSSNDQLQRCGLAVRFCFLGQLGSRCPASTASRADAPYL